MSKVISLTLFRLELGILRSFSITCSALVPAIIATILPAFPLAFLLVTIVYRSPLDKAASSIESRFPIFSGKSNQSLACDFSFHCLKSLK